MFKINRGLILALAIFTIGFLIRVYSLNWDQNQHLHPDERFLTMVAGAMHLPDSIGEYLDPARSPLNPYNAGHNFFVYGTFPLTLVKIIAVAAHLDDYNNFVLLGRFMSAIVDTGTLVFVFLLVKLWGEYLKFDTRLKYIAAFLYALSVLPIQQSHFFTTDSFLVFFVMASVYFAIRHHHTKKLFWMFLSALLFGLALASKINAVLAVPLLGLVISGKPELKKGSYWIELTSRGIMFFCIALIVMRIADPKAFSAGIFSLMPSQQYVDNLKQLESFNNPDAWYPPGVQWINKSKIIFSLVNVVFFGLGIPYFLLLIIGFYNLVSKKKYSIGILALWLLAVFLYQSTQHVQTMRYFYLLYPFFAILGALGAVSILNKTKKWNSVMLILLVLTVSLWPVSFIRIYQRPHSRVQASYWIRDNIPKGSFIALEHWDDPLPLLVEGVAGGDYPGEGLPVFDRDTDEKWQKIDEILSKSDYLILTSNRGYGSISTVPDRYPRMGAFYQGLFVGKTEFKKIKEISSYPKLCFIKDICVEFPDQWSEEAFTVYDHPKVTIFKKVL